LFSCEYHELRWRNQKSGLEGVSKLTPKEETDNTFLLTWELPPEACTEAGTLEISVSCYDRLVKGDTTSSVIYSWNTSEYTGLSIGKSMGRVGFYTPAKDEILLVDKDSRNIVAPQGYNNTIGNFGESGISNVYFLINRYLGKDNSLDVMNANITLYIVIPEVMTAKTNSGDILKRLYTEEITDRKNEGLVLLTWPVPKAVTANWGAYAGSFNIALGIETEDNSFLSNTYTKLAIGDSLIRRVTPITPPDPENPDENLEATIFKSIDKYFAINDVSFFSELTD
jgi:hypothetical protein